MTSLRSKLRLFVAILVAALWTEVTDPAAYRRIWNALTLWFGAMQKGSRVDERTYQRRMYACQNCPLFFKPLMTCGTPLRPDKRGLGCYCCMQYAAKLADKGCWLDENSDMKFPYGWKAFGVE